MAATGLGAGRRDLGSSLRVGLAGWCVAQVAEAGATGWEGCRAGAEATAAFCVDASGMRAMGATWVGCGAVEARGLDTAAVEGSLD